MISYIICCKQYLILKILLFSVLMTKCLYIGDVINFNDKNLTIGLMRNKNNTKTFKNINLYNNFTDFITKNWTIDIGIKFRNLAGLGYLRQENFETQLNELWQKEDKRDEKKISSFIRIFFEDQKWDYIGTFTGDEDTNRYAFSVMSNKNQNKIVVSFSGSVIFNEIYNQIFDRGGEIYFRKTHKYQNYIYIVKYFQNIYIKIKREIKKFLIKANYKEYKQIIFTGHSLGGAIASIAAFDLVTSGFIEKSDISPSVITYGQPRTGNYAFANEFMKSVPIIYRVMNYNDFASGFPACQTDENSNCINEFSQKKLDLNFSDYENFLLPENQTFFPWHNGGLILIKNDEVRNCYHVSEPVTERKCKYKTSPQLDYHYYYLGYRIYHFSDPEIYGYDLTKTPEIFKIEKEYLGFLNPKKLLFGFARIFKLIN